jgi:predicted DsbA family dithiol-disulfide isomerase
MNDGTAPILVDYYTDVLCVWAWIAQPRLEELRKQWGEQIKIQHRYIDIFGNARKKIPAQWGERDGFDKFHEHVRHAAEPYEHTQIHSDIWTRVRPNSSITAHLFLNAVAIAADESQMDTMATMIRRQFFTQATNVGDLEVLLDMSDELPVKREEILAALTDGRAMSALSADLKNAKDNAIKGSPSWVLNNGRQILYGNVGYRILNSNIEELLNNPSEEASWC